MSDSVKKYFELIEEGKIKNDTNIIGNGGTGRKWNTNPKSFRDIYEDFVQEHNDPTNTTLFVDYLESRYNNPTKHI